MRLRPLLLALLRCVDGDSRCRWRRSVIGGGETWDGQYGQRRRSWGVEDHRIGDLPGPKLDGLSPCRLIVQKYGGTSVATPDRIRTVAERVARARKDGSDVMVVVSAMGDTTDELLELALQVSPRPTGARARHAAHRR